MAKGVLEQELRSKLGSVLEDLRAVGKAQTDLQKRGAKLTKQEQDALKALRQRYKDSAREAQSLQTSVEKMAKSQKNAAQGQRRISQEVQKTTRGARRLGESWGRFESMIKGGAALAGVTAMLGKLIQIGQEIDRANERAAQRGAGRGRSALDLGSSLVGFGIVDKNEQERVTRAITSMPGPAPVGEVTQFLEAIPGATLSGDEVIEMARVFQKSGGSGGLFGGQNATAFGELFAATRGSINVGDAADMAMMFQQRSGQKGLSKRLMKSVNKLAPYMPMSMALSLAATFTEAKQEATLETLATDLQRGTERGYGLDDVLSGKQGTASTKTAVGGVQNFFSRQGRDFAAELRQNAQDFESVSGRDYVSELVDALPQRARDEMGARADERLPELGASQRGVGREQRARRARIESVQQYMEDQIPLLSVGMSTADTVLPDRLMDPGDQLQPWRAAWSGLLRGESSGGPTEVRLSEQDRRIARQSQRSPAAIEEGLE